MSSEKKELGDCAADQTRLWDEFTLVADEPTGLFLIQSIADSLLTLEVGRHPSDDHSARFEYEHQIELGPYAVPVPSALEERVREALNHVTEAQGHAGCGVRTFRILDTSEISGVSAPRCAPFALGPAVVVRRATTAAGESYFVDLEIQIVHLGEAMIHGSACILIHPRAKVRIRPRPNVDSVPILRETMLDWLSREIHRRSEPRSYSPVENAFPGGEGRVPNNHVVTAGLLALNKAGKRARQLENGWFENGLGRLTCRYQPRATKRIDAHIVQEELGDDVSKTEKVWKFIEEELHPETQDVALGVLAQLCCPSVGESSKYPMLIPVIIDAKTILSYRTFRGQNHNAALAMIHSAMEHLSRLSFDVTFESPIYGHGLRWLDDRLFHVVKIEQFNMFDESKPDSSAWAIRAGLWASVWFQKDTRSYIGSMAATLLEFGSSRKRLLAKRIGQRLLLLSQVVQPRGTVEVFVHTLLEDIGELLTIDRRDKSWASRLREVLETALDMLVERGVFKSITWPNGFGPSDTDRSKGWVQRWLNAKIRVTTMRGEVPSEAKGGAKAAHSQALTGSEVRSARQNTFPPRSQQQLALELGISRRQLSGIETGDRKPSPMLTEKIRKWIRSEQGKQSGERRSDCTGENA